jgi:phosphoheptose isomerase
MNRTVEMATDAIIVSSIQKRLRQSIELGHQLSLSSTSSVLAEIAKLIAKSFNSGNKLFTFGNGGLAPISSHFVAELVGTMGTDRSPYPAISLSDNTASITAIANDHGYEQVFARQLQAFGKSGDVAIALSASGTSPNIVNAAAMAKTLKMTVIAMTSGTPTHLQELADIFIAFPTADQKLMQEYCLHFCHSLALLIEDLTSITSSPH